MSRALFTQYPSPNNTQPLTNNSSQPRTPSTLQSSQSNNTQIVDSFLSDVPQSIYSEYSTLSASDLAPHTPESLLYSPALDSSRDERTDLNSRKQREQQPILRRSPRILSNQTPLTSEQQSDTTSLKSIDSSNNRELINNPAALALEVLNEPTDLSLIQQLLSEHINREVSPSKLEEKNTLVSRNLDNSRLEQEFPTSLIDTENRDISELRDLITTSNMILDSVHHSSASHKSQEVDEGMRDIDYTHEQQQKGIIEDDKSSTQPYEVSQSSVQSELEHEVEYPESVNFVITNEISDTLLRQSEHYNDMASKFSNLKFIKVQPESDEEIEQFTTPIAPEIRRSTRKRTMANYSYPRYSYGGGSSKRPKTRRRNRSFRKSLSDNINSEVVDVDNKRNEETDEPMREFSPVQSGEEQDESGAHNIQGSEDVCNVNKSIPDESQGNLYLKHDLRSRKILLELPEGVARGEETEAEDEPVVASSSKNTKIAKKPAKKATLKAASKTSAKITRKRKTFRRKSTSRKKNEDPEWHLDEAINESSNDGEAVVSALTTSNPRGRRATSKTRSASIAPVTVTSKKTTAKKDVTTSEITKRSSSKKATPKTSKTPKTSGKKSVQSTRGRRRGRGRTIRSSRSKDSDVEYKYSEGEESESESEIEIEITKSVSVEEPEVEINEINDNSENQIVRELSDIEMDDAIQDELEPSVVVEEPVLTPTRPKRTRKNTRSISEHIISAPKYSYTRYHRGRGSSKRGGRRGVSTQADYDATRDNAVSSIHEPSDKEEANVQVDLIPATQPKKAKSSTRGKGRTRGGKGKGRVDGNTATDHPSVPASDPDIVEISAGNPTALANAVRALAGQNYDIIHSPKNIMDIASIEAPVFVKPHSPATRSTSLSNTPPSELQETLTKFTAATSHTSSLLSWSNDHWYHLKVFYEETKSEYIRSGKVVSGNEDVYKEVTEKFFEVDANNRTFGEENLRMRIIALESEDFEKSSEPSGSIQRSSSIGSSSSRGSRSSVSRYNKAYLNLRDNVAGAKRKRRESDNKNVDKKEEDKDKVSKRSRVEENTPSGSPASDIRPRVEESTPSESSTTSLASGMNITQTTNDNSILSKLFRGWFSGSRSRSNPASFNEATPGELANNAGENENIMEDDEEPPNPTPIRSRSWMW